MERPAHPAVAVLPVERKAERPVEPPAVDAVEPAVVADVAAVAELPRFLLVLLFVALTGSRILLATGPPQPQPISTRVVA